MEQKKLTERAAIVTRRFYELNEKARKLDLSYLNDNIDYSRNNYRDIFEYGLLLCVSGADAARLDLILSNLIKRENNEQERRFKSIQKEAALHIQKGSHSTLFLCSLFSYLNIEEVKETAGFLSGSVIYDDLQSLLEKPSYQNEISGDDYDASKDTLAKPFCFFNSVDSGVLLEHIKREQPDVIAYVLALIDPKKASHILSNLSADLQYDIVYRIAVMDTPGFELLRDMLRLETKLLSVSGGKNTVIDSGGFKKLLQAYLLRENAVKEAVTLYEKASGVTAGSQAAVDLTNRLLKTMQGKPLDFIKTDPAVFFKLLVKEHPKTIACIFLLIQPSKAALMLQFLPDYLQCDVARRIALMDKSGVVTQEMRETAGEISPLDIRRMEKALSAMFNKDCVFKGGIKALTDLMFLVDNSAEKTIMDFIEKTYPELIEPIGDYMFVFEDIVMLNDQAIQKVLRNADKGYLTIALKNTSKEVKDRIFANISKSSAVMLKEDMDFMKPASDDECDEAKKKIVSVIRRLEELGEIVSCNLSDKEYV